MGHSLDEWRSKVSRLVRDLAGRDVLADIDEVGITPALARYSEDRPRRVVEEVPGDGSAYLDLPDGWVTDVSHVEDIEYPARQNPRVVLDRSLWSIVQSDADVLVDSILLSGQYPSASEWVRIIYLTSWPMPGSDPDTDQVGAAAYEAVTKLAAAFCLDMLAAEAARNLHGAIPTDLVSGEERSLMLGSAADRYRSDYERFVARFGVGSTSARVGSIPLARIV